MSTDPVLLVDRTDDGIVTLTFNRPKARNAFSRALAGALIEAFDALEHDKSVRVLVLTGAGDRAFSAGADLKERVTMSEPEVREFVGRLQSTMSRLERMAPAGYPGGPGS